MNSLRSFVRSILLCPLVWGVFGGGTPSAQAQGNQCCLPPSQVCLFLTTNFSTFADGTFSQIPPGYSVTNGTYPCWCVQFEVLIDTNIVYKALLYDAGAALPAHLQNSPWDKVNYILNHKLGTPAEIQNAIWAVLGQAIEPPFTANSVSMTNAAHQFGMGFVPTNGQVKSVIVDTQEVPPVQRLICEVVCVEDTADNPPANATFTSTAFLPGGQFKFELTAQAGRCFVIESSANLMTWTPLVTLIRTNGVMEFTDTNAASFNARFYRARRL